MKKLVLAASLCLAGMSAAQAEDLNQLTQDTRAKAVPVLPKIVGMLTATVKERGVADAIPVCKVKAPALLKQQSEELGWMVRRVSLKTRNAERATPDVWEARNLAEFDIRAAQGADPKTLEASEIVTAADGKRYLRYMKALPVMPVCLNCHGDAASLAPAVRETLQREYPDDRATGYSAGQIRGALTVTRPL